MTDEDATEAVPTASSSLTDAARLLLLAAALSPLSTRWDEQTTLPPVNVVTVGGRTIQ